MIRHIVFDFGGVILDLDGVHTGYPDVLAEIFQIDLEQAKAIWDENKTGVITGKESPKEFLVRMKAELQLDFDVDRAINFWEEKNFITQDRIDWQLVGMMESLKNEYQIHLLTDQINLNNGASAWMCDVTRHCQKILRSYEQGYRKPSPEAFENLLAKINAPNTPDSVIFIDDSQQNVDAANAAGIHGILYRFMDRKALKQQLYDLGVEITTAQQRYNDRQ